MLVTGASGVIGGRLIAPLLEAGHRVRAMGRDPGRLDLPDEVETVKADAVEGEGLEAALEGVDVAYYLIHSMGAGGDDFAARDRAAARNFGKAASRAGVARLVYLGGLAPADGGSGSEHLRSRQEVADTLAAEHGGVVHARAAMIIGAGSASFTMLDALVRRLPAMICPRWIETRSQPIAIGDVVGALTALAARDDTPAEVQLGGADVLTYREMMQRHARVIGRRPPPIVRVPVLTPRLSSYWVTLVTPVEHGLVRPLVDGLAAEMVVSEPPPPGINDEPMGFEAAARAAAHEASPR